MGRPSVVVLAGTTEATRLAEVLDRDGIDVTSSLAGVTSAPVGRPGRVRRGPFGGVAGLADHLVREQVDALVDATHPFAAVMPFHAEAAGRAAGVPTCRLLRAPWSPAAGDRWVEVDDVEGAAATLDRIEARRVLLATGRQRLDAFLPCRNQSFVVRSIEPPTVTLPGMTSVLDRGPFDLAAERTLLARYAIDTMVTKNAGGSATAAKLAAARALGVTVVMVARPPQPAGVEVVADVEGAVGWLSRVLARTTAG